VTYFDASFYLLRVSAPVGQVVASGLLLAQDDQARTFAAGPARDFYLAASEDFAVFSRRVGETTVNSYAISQRAGRAKLALDFAADALASFNQRFGPYPYTELDVVCTPMQASGIEYPGIVGISLDLYNPALDVSAPAGSAPQALLDSPIQVLSLAWSPDGAQIAFMYQRGASWPILPTPTCISPRFIAQIAQGDEMA
jgi:hypothetical protein